MTDKKVFPSLSELSRIDPGEFYRLSMRGTPTHFGLDLARGPDMTATEVMMRKEELRYRDLREEERLRRKYDFEEHYFQDQCNSLIEQMPREWMPLVWQFDCAAVHLWYVHHMSFTQAKAKLLAEQNEEQLYRTNVPQLGRQFFERKSRV